MKYLAIILAAAAVAYLIMAVRLKLWPWGGKSGGATAPNGDIAKALARLGIPAPNLSTATTTAQGVRVLSTVPVPPVALDTIDAGLSELFTWYHAAFPAWNNAFKHSDYAVMFIEPMATNQDASPAIKVQTQQSAGTCIGFPFPMVYIVLPHQAKQGWAFKDYLYNSVFNEGEHYIESHNSREVFNRYTGLQDTHPHISPPMVGLKATIRVSSNCGLERV